MYAGALRISPCPLATNIAAVSFIGTGATPGRAALCGLAYAAGRMASYLALGIVLVSGVLSSTVLSGFLQGIINRILGPVLILAGMVLLDLLSWRGSGSEPGEALRRQVMLGLSQYGYEVDECEQGIPALSKIKAADEAAITERFRKNKS